MGITGRSTGTICASGMNTPASQERADLFEHLARSTFRSRFKLGARERDYIAKNGMEAILRHTCEFVDQRLGPAHPPNDGRQTPMRGHPVFLAQHATATCCRSCLSKWHRITAGRELSTEERRYVVAIIDRWLRAQPGLLELSKTGPPIPHNVVETVQPDFFGGRGR